MTSLYSKLQERETAGKPINVGLIGAGKFGSMYLSSIYRIPGVHLLGVADLSPDRAMNSLKRTGFPTEKVTQDEKLGWEAAAKKGQTIVTTDSTKLIAAPTVDVVIEATGIPSVGVKHALLACEHKTHIIMVNVEADVLAGPLLVRKAKEAGIIYSMAWGDQPALIAELVDWARSTGFKVVCAGKGTKHLPRFHESTPDTVWDNYGFTKEQLATGDFNPQMFNSFLDGTKSALEMTAVANGCDLAPPSDGLLFPPSGTKELPIKLKPKSEGGVLEQSGTVEVVSCLNTDETWVNNDLRFGVYIIIEAGNDYQKDCFAQYGLTTDSSGRFAAQYKPFHLIGLELGISVAQIILRGEPTGQTKTWAGDVVACAKRELKAGEILDGEGGHMAYGKLIPAKDSLKLNGLPIGLAHKFKLKRNVAKGQRLSWDDIEADESTQVVRIRREMERVFKKEFGL